MLVELRFRGVVDQGSRRFKIGIGVKGVNR